MALQKKRSHPIQVDGIGYRWTLQARGLNAHGMTPLVIQSDNNGQRLIVNVPVYVWYDIHSGEQAPEFSYDGITPRLVRKVILAAQGLGWDGTKRGKEICFELLEDESLGKMRS